MANENIFTLFEGLTLDEARQFRRAIFPALQKIRAEITENRQPNEAQTTSRAIISRGNKDAMQSNDTNQ